jgi:hypothetical protein|tara:strand:- start:166 stop:336 length:171 start_codon:yes stop_codon:yes gene_type:complete
MLVTWVVKRGKMPRKNHTPEQLINKPQEAEVTISGGGTVGTAAAGSPPYSDIVVGV